MSGHKASFKLTHGYELCIIGGLIGEPKPYLWVGPQRDDLVGPIYTSQHDAGLLAWLCKALDVVAPGCQVIMPKEIKP